MYFLKTEAAFDSAHFLKNYDGKCSNIHGHRWRVVVEIGKSKLNTDKQTCGMVMDFGDIKAILKEICDELDHCFIAEEGSLKQETLKALREENFKMIMMPFRPTAENLAHYIYDRMKAEMIPIFRVEVYETPNNCAIYEEQ